MIVPAGEKKHEDALHGVPHKDADYLHNAYRLALVADAVYSNSPEEEHRYIDDSYDRVIPFHAERVYGFVLTDQNSVVLAFRGTSEEREWMRGMSYSQVDRGPGRVHKGLHDTLDSVWTDILAAFYDVDVHNKALWLTGHSLGGSLATVSAHRLEADGFAVHEVHTFGSPPVLDPKAARAFGTTMYRFVNNEDLVPVLPWPTLTDTYEHVGKEVLLLASGRIAKDRHSTDLARKIDRAESIGEGPQPAGMFHDHKMENYLAKLSAHL